VTEFARQGSEDVQHYTEGAVRYLLHRVAKPYELAHAPYVKELCSATGEPNASRALRRLVEEALPGASYAEGRLRNLILRMDFDDGLTADELAKEEHLSRRQVQRMRAEAVRMIAYKLRLTFGVNAQLFPEVRAASVGPLEDLAAIAHRAPLPVEGPARFQPEYASFERARERNDALEMRAISGSLRRLASDSTLTLALRCQAEACLRLGRYGLAAGILEDALKRSFVRKESSDFAALTLLRAHIHYFHGDAETARELAAGALKALTPLGNEWIDAHLLLSRVALKRHLPWKVPFEATTMPADSYGGIAFAVMQAEHAGEICGWKRARELAEPALLRAEQLELDGVAAGAAAVLSRACCALGQLDEALQYRARALRWLLRTQDYFVGRGLFEDVPQLDSGHVDEALLDAIFERVGLLVPQLVNDDARQTDAVRRLIEEIVARAVDRFRPRRRMEAAIERVRVLDSAFAAYGTTACEALDEMLTLALLALTGQAYWSGRHPALREAFSVVRQAFCECRRAGLLVGYPSPRSSVVAKASIA
jgi:tetratricopeptide (TPR) repeat protein